MLIKHLLLPALFLAAPLAAPAQIITDTTKATAGRDSLFQQARFIRQQVEQKAHDFVLKAHGIDRRRHVTRGYGLYAPKNALEPRHPMAWKHVVRYRRNGITRERYIVYSNGQPIMQEYRSNGQVTYLSVQGSVPVEASQPVRASGRGIYAREGYLKWNGKQYILPHAH